jgi:hypothetical protein
MIKIFESYLNRDLYVDLKKEVFSGHHKYNSRRKYTSHHIFAHKSSVVDPNPDPNPRGSELF